MGPRVDQELFELQPPERLKRFRQLASDARRFAGEVRGAEFREAYLRIASRWDLLAQNLEQSLASRAK